MLGRARWDCLRRCGAGSCPDGPGGVCRCWSGDWAGPECGHSAVHAAWLLPPPPLRSRPAAAHLLDRDGAEAWGAGWWDEAAAAAVEAAVTATQRPPTCEVRWG